MKLYSTVPWPTTVILIENNTLLAGSTATLQCNVSLRNYISYSSLPIMVTVELLKRSTTVMTHSASVEHSSAHNHVFNISDMGVFNTGQYQCRATVRANQTNVLDSSPGVSNTANLNIQGKSY